jgi:hypothetical protein
MTDVLLPQNIAAVVLKAWAAAWGWVLSRTNITYISAHGIYSESLVLACYTASQCSMHCLSSHLFPMMFKDWSLRIPEKCDHNFFNCWLKFELLFDRGCQVFAFHTMASSLWLIMVDPNFITSYNATQKDVIFLMVLAQK